MNNSPEQSSTARRIQIKLNLNKVNQEAPEKTIRKFNYDLQAPVEPPQHFAGLQEYLNKPKEAQKPSIGIHEYLSKPAATHKPDFASHEYLNKATKIQKPSGGVHEYLSTSGQSWSPDKKERRERWIRLSKEFHIDKTQFTIDLAMLFASEKSFI